MKTYSTNPQAVASRIRYYSACMAVYASRKRGLWWFEDYEHRPVSPAEGLDDKAAIRWVSKKARHWWNKKVGY